MKRNIFKPSFDLGKVVIGLDRRVTQQGLNVASNSRRRSYSVLFVGRKLNKGKPILLQINNALDASQFWLTKVSWLLGAFFHFTNASEKRSYHFWRRSFIFGLDYFRFKCGL